MATCVLYITYDGIMEPLGQSQVLQYLITLAKRYNILLISYEKPSDWKDENRRNVMLEETRKAGIRWVPLRYHKSPSALATAYDVAIGFCISFYLAIRNNIKIVHARSYVPSVIALGLKKIFKTRFIFDMRGFWADEHVERGSWRNYCQKERCLMNRF